MAMPPMQLSASSSASSKSGDASGAYVAGSTFNTGYFGTGTDTAGILEKIQIPLIIFGVVAVLWMLKKKR